MGPLCIGSVDNKVKVVYFHLNNIAWVPYGPHTRIVPTWDPNWTHMRSLYYISVFTTNEMFIFIWILWDSQGAMTYFSVKKCQLTYGSHIGP